MLNVNLIFRNKPFYETVYCHFFLNHHLINKLKNFDTSKVQVNEALIKIFNLILIKVKMFSVLILPITVKFIIKLHFIFEFFAKFI